jgi:two-component system OmpR family response regulator
MTTKGAPRILIVDDEPSIVDPLSARLRDAGFIVNEAGTGRRALALAQEDPPDLLVVDVMLRELDGIEIVRRLRADGMRAPVIFLTARDTLQDRVAEVSIGGGDYVAKPFALTEMVARVYRVLRRVGRNPSDNYLLRYADLELDESTYEVRRAGQDVRLTATEFNVMRYFLLNPRQVLSKSQILDYVWPHDFEGSANVVETYVSYLRKKLEKHGPPLIHTVRLGGYVLREAEPDL